MNAITLEKAQRLRDQGVSAIASSRWGEAVSLLSSALWLAGSEASLHELRAQAYLGLCDASSALLDLRRALKLTLPDRAEREERGGEEEEKPNGERARRSELLARLLDVRVLALLDEGSFALALSTASEAVALCPKDPFFRLRRALALSCLDRYAEALQDLELCVGVSPPSCDMLYLKAKLHLHLKQLPPARAAVDDALELEPTHAPSKALLATMLSSSEVYVEEATKLMLLGHHEDAATNLTHAMQLQPRKPELRLRRGGALRQQGKLQEAILDFERAIAEAGGGNKLPGATRMLVLSYNDLGVKLAKQQLHADALRWFSRALDLDESNAAFFLNRADCHHTVGNSTEALCDLERAYDLSSHDVETQWQIRTRLAMVHNERGTQLFNYSDARSAAVEFSRAIECNPKIAKFHTNRAEALMMLKAYTRARDDLLSALHLNPDESRAQELLDSMCPS